MAGGWGCPHEVGDVCTKLGGIECDPGTKGCVLAGRYRFLDDDKSVRFLEKKERENAKESTKDILADSSCTPSGK